MKKDVREGRITIAAPAKVNLYLGVHTQKDERGYHLVDSVMAALALCDEVVVESAADLQGVMEPGIDVPVERSNVWKAAVRLAEAFGVPAQAHIRVTQHIPMCAGLGGSSSDAGATLRGLCALWGIDVADPRVAAVARGIGADVPFFLDPRPSHLVGGGDVLAETFIDGRVLSGFRPRSRARGRSHGAARGPAGTAGRGRSACRGKRPACCRGRLAGGGCVRPGTRLQYPRPRRLPPPACQRRD